MVHMSRHRRWLAAMTFGFVMALMFAFLGCSTQRPNTVEHVVLILKENHTFDNYFGTFPGADGATTGISSTGLVVRLMPMPDADQVPPERVVEHVEPDVHPVLRILDHHVDGQEVSERIFSLLGDIDSAVENVKDAGVPFFAE